MEVTKRKYKPSEVATLWGCGVEKVLSLIRSGQLRATNIAADPHGSPRFRVDVADLEAFERLRAVTPPPSVQRRRKAKLTPGEQYYHDMLSRE